MSDQPWAREVRRVAGPAIAQSLGATLVFAVDRAMLGHAGTDALAAMQIAGPLEWSILSVFSAFEVAAVAIVGAAVGAAARGQDDAEDRARGASRLALVFAVGVGLAVAAATPLALRVLGDGAAARAAVSYLQATLIASPFAFVHLGATAVCQARGDTRSPLAVAVVAQLAHVALNRVLILGAFGVAGRGIAGAGLSTAATFALQAALLGGLLLRRGWLAPPRRPLPGLARELVRVGGPALAERTVYHAGFLVFVALITGLGEAAMAANQALIAVESLCFNAADGFGAATAATVARAQGAGSPAGVRAVLRRGLRDAVAVLALAGVLAALLRGPILGLFGADGAVIALAGKAIFVLAVAQPAMAAGTVLAAGLRGLGETRRVLAVSTVGALFVRCAATYLFAYRLGLGLVGIWLGSTTDWLVRTALLGWLLRRGPEALVRPVPASA